MAKVLRCPACGALWRVKDDFAEPTVRCSECQAIFSADKMENVIVPDEKLDERLHQQAAAQNPSQTSAESGEATMTALAGSLAEFDARATPEAPANEATSKPSSSHPVLWTLGTLVVLVGAGAAGLLRRFLVQISFGKMPMLLESWPTLKCRLKARASTKSKPRAASPQSLRHSAIVLTDLKRSRS